MRRLHGILLNAAGLLAGLVAGLVVAPATAAAAAPPVVNWAHSVEDDLGTLEVSATAEAGVADLRAHIKRFDTGQDVAVVDNFALSSGTAQDGVWRTPEPVQLPELGYYQVVVDVTDSDGVQASGPSFGSFAYLVRTAFSPLALNPPTATYTRRDVRVSGTLTGIMPGTRQTVPVPGVTVYVIGVYAEDQPASVTTAEDGSFTATLRVTGPGDVYAEFGSEDNYLRATSDTATVAVSPARSKITVGTSRRQVDQGDTITLSGQLTWRSPQGWQPLANTQIGVLFCQENGYCPNAEYPVTDVAGRYELTVAPGETGYYSVGFPSHDPFIADANARVDVVVWQPAFFSDFTGARDESGAVVVRGHMQFDDFTPSPIPVRIQYRAEGTNTWTTVTTVDDAYWDGTGYGFTATVTEPGKGRWRAFYEGRPKMFRPAASTPVLVR